MTHFDPNHTPVLLEEALAHFAPQKGDSVLDVTLGLGGHSGAFLRTIGPTGALTALDADSDNLETAKDNLKEYERQCTFIHSNFKELPHLGLPKFDIIFADLGLSSPHLDDPEKGFSFRSSGPLDMRFDRTAGATAAELISSLSQDDLADVLFYNGEIRQSRKLAAVLKTDLPKTTAELQESCQRVFGFKTMSYLAQVFQALRIAVNSEFDALHTLLELGPKMLNPGGRIGIISFHSLEDRAVKQSFKMRSTPEIDDTTGAIAKEAAYELVTRKAVKPTEKEIEQNPRARSAVLRVLKKR